MITFLKKESKFREIKVHQKMQRSQLKILNCNGNKSKSEKENNSKKHLNNSKDKKILGKKSERNKQNESKNKKDKLSYKECKIKKKENNKEK